MSKNAAVTAIITAHREGLLCWPSLRSVSRAKEHAESYGFNVEIILALDRPDQATRDMADQWHVRGSRKIVLDNGDPGSSRNDAVAHCTTDWIAFLDADDLWGENWLTDAFSAARSDPRNIVWHPEVNIYFGHTKHLFRHIDMEQDEFKLSSLVGNNYWTSLCFCRKDLLRTVPYPKNQFYNKIGHEDWAWNRAVIEAGATHKVVRGTGHAIRTSRQHSVSKLATLHDSIPNPTYLFQNELQKRIARLPT
jgi:glycosyltransferase involved in cell wall biosynthesis